METDVSGHKPLIAASIGPYGACLADGSEYRGDYNITDEELKHFHQPRINILDKTNADFFACETIPSLQEAKVLGEILQDTQKQGWVSFSCKDEMHLYDGSSIKEGVEILKGHSNIFAIGVNCTAPQYVSSLIRAIKGSINDKKIVVYANSGEAYNAETKTWSNVAEPDSFVNMTTEWLELGADIIGGCCRIGPIHIRQLQNQLIDG
jgi:homocysteine S-methyltransferase